MNKYFKIMNSDIWEAFMENFLTTLKPNLY